MERVKVGRKYGISRGGESSVGGRADSSHGCGPGLAGPPGFAAAPEDAACAL